MNKDVIYIEPMDDITDIITKIENAKEKIVALVPPKKAGVFRSIVNIKLIAKAGANAGKTVVIVTTDPAIMKMAGVVRLPVAKNLQSAPEVPGAEMVAEMETKAVDENAMEIAKNAENDDENVKEPGEPSQGGKSAQGAKKGLESENGSEKDGENDDNELDDRGGKHRVKDDDVSMGGDDDDETGDDVVSDRDDKNGKKAKKKIKKFSKTWFSTYKWQLMGAGAIGVALLIVLIWMFAIAPSAIIAVGIRTSTANFSENVTFVSKMDEENAEEGKFYLTEKKIENTAEVKFEATGKKNVGAKASGKVQIYAYLKSNESVTVASGATLTNDGKKYIVDESVTLAPGNSASDCANASNLSQIMTLGCLIYGSLDVTAGGAGTEYNLSASSGWSISTAGVGVASGSVSGGTDEFVTVVQESDIGKAQKDLVADGTVDNKGKLFDSIDQENDLAIETSYKQVTSNAESTPKVGEEVKNGEKATLKVTTTDTVYVVDRVKVEEFIKTKAKLSENFRIYSMNDPFIENFAETDGGATGKLKTAYVSGPSVTENDIVEMARGKGVGTATHDISGIDGIGMVTINTSFPWVTAVPGDPNKITVIIDTGE